MTDELVWREPFESHEPPGEALGADEVGEMLHELWAAVVVKAFNGGFFDGAVHPLHLAVGTRVLYLG